MDAEISHQRPDDPTTVGRTLRITLPEGIPGTPTV